MPDSRTNPYLRDAVLTASPEKLQLMLYDGAIRFLRQANEAIDRKDFETSFLRLTRAQNIVLEMRNGLNFDVNPELCKRAAAIYDFLYHKLIEANVTRDPRHIADALRVLEIERETWRMIVDKLTRGEPTNPTDLPKAGSSEPASAPAARPALSIEG